ncbi:glycosyltransferase [Atribacter laminatus]|jgi:colanic acid/amylovoran biosynthesis glycosyltransferase|uniref:Alpha-D-kanosaminyltransferase n=1 Tax=Atribacter laminatus TaxID=2847778 RepID=A0A7T1F2I0_ATRLM|nr:glycosyltransferase [Atribacter laminatus]QPM67315.1 Alpha-D-kanosaminyltransferase [Atribacter laminatus]
MKIAFIVGAFPKLSETFILNQITGLLELGHEVDIFAGFNPYEKKVQPDIEKYKIMKNVYYLNMPTNKIRRVFKGLVLLTTNFHKDPVILLKALNIFIFGKSALSLRLLYAIIPFLGKKKDYDVIHCQFGPNGNLGALLKQLGIQGILVTTFHGYDIRLGIEKRGNIYHKLFKSCDCILAISDYNYENLIRLGADPKKIFFHSVGINLNIFPYRWRSAGFGHSNAIVILTVARLVEEKGLEYGIRAVAQLLELNHGLQLEYRIIGGGPLEKQLKQLVEKLGLGGVVHFLGPMGQADVVQEMLRANLFLLPSIAEALPVSLMEAQAVGLPVVATSVGSTSKVIIDGKSGFLAPARDVNALVERLEHLIKHPEIWQEFGKTGRRFVEEHYDIKKLNQQLVEIYRNLINSKYQ